MANILQNETKPADAPRTVSKQDLLQDAIEFQLKLFVDGIRDVLLVPISLIAALLDFIAPASDRGKLFYRVMRIGKDSENWLNLFGALERVQPVGQDEDRVAVESSEQEKE